MADQGFAVAFAIDVQAAFGTINGTTRDLGSTLTSADGIVKGNKESGGDGDSGITIPNFERIVREVSKVDASFTESADAFLRTAVNGLSIAYAMQGNGATSGVPGASEADPLPGTNAILECSGLIGSAGSAAPDEDFDPRHSGSSGGSTIYATIKIWIGDSTTGMSYVFQDCLCESLAFVSEPDGNCIATANFRVGSLAVAAVGVTFPSLDFTTQVSMAAPIVAGATFSVFNQARGFNTLTITVQNEIEEVKDSSVPVTGLRQAQARRQFLVDGTLYVASGDVDAAFTEHINTSAPTNDLTLQIGTAESGGGSEIMNAFLFNCNNLEAKDIKYTELGEVVAVEISGAKCTGLTAGSEFKLIFN